MANTSIPAAAHLAAVIGLGQRLLVHQAAARGVDDDDARLGLGQRLLVDEARRLRRLRQVHRDEVGAAEQFVEGQQLDAELRGTRVRHVGVIGDDVGAESGQALGDQLPDAAQPDDPDRLAEDLGAGKLRPLPGVLPQRCVGRGDLTSCRQQQRHSVLGGAVDVGGRRVDDQYAALGGGVDVDVVQPDTGTGDDLQLGRCGQHLGVDGGRRPDQQRIGVGHRGEQFVPVGSVNPADLDLVAQGVNS